MALSKEQQIEKILLRFPTERYKQFAYQIRPFLTMAMTLVLLILGILHIVNFVVIAWVMAAFVLDNVALTSIMSVARAINHLANGRKQIKAIVMLVMVSLALVTGACLGYFVLAHMPLVISAFSNYISLTGCSPFLISMGALLGGYVSHATHKIPLFWGIFLGSCIASVIYFPIPIAFEIIYFSAIASAFFATIVAKQSMRLYYKLSYGHTNADGYNIAKNPTELRAFILSQADKFSVSPSHFEALAYLCRNRIDQVKRESSFWDEYMCNRNHITNSHKDIYHLLMSAKLSTPEEIQEAKYVIANSNLPSEFKTPENKTKVKQMLRLGTFFNPDLALRTTVHQFEIDEAGVLDPNLLRSFRV